MSLLNRTVGRPITVRLPPKFDGFTVVGGTWKPEDQTKNKEHQDETEQVFNIGFYAPGTKVTCELYQNVTDPVTADLQVSQVISEVATGDNPNPGKWVVMKADPMDFGTSGIKFSVQLMRYDNMDLTQVTVNP